MSKNKLPGEAAALTQHLRGLSDEQIQSLKDELNTEFDSIYGDGTNAKMDVTRLEELTAQIEAVDADFVVRETEAAEVLKKTADLNARRAAKATTPDPEGSDGDAESGDGSGAETAPADPEVAPSAPEAIAASLMSAVSSAVEAAVAKIRPTVAVEDVLKSGEQSLNQHLRLGDAARYTPPALVRSDRTPSVITASADIPGFAQGSRIETIDRLAEAIHMRARTLGVTERGNDAIGTNLVAALNRDFRHTLDLTSTPAEMERVLREATDVESLVAAGGWCAPSEISYDFYNIVCEDGLLDLPSVGVLNRGGFRWPISPTLADVTALNPDGLWTWTETDDQSAVTGAPTKDCVRVPCPSFDEIRLACDGLCVTAGNLMDFAYPENIRNFLRLLFAARAKTTNSRIINIISANSTAVTIGGVTGGLVGDVMHAINISAQDYRDRFGMCDDAIIEVNLPKWLQAAMRDDWMRRAFTSDPILANNRIMDMFDASYVRVQFIQDWQVRASNKPGASTAITNWPTTVQMQVYAPGTWVKGQGLQLNLGVVRDSVLNATNDYTAAWMEDCYAVAKVGHLSRLVTFNVCTDGTTGALNLDCG